MATTTVIDVAEAVNTEINSPVPGTTWLQSEFDCAQEMLPAYTDAEVAARIKIAVIPIDEDCERIARNATERQHTIQLWFQKKVPTAPLARDTAVKALARFACQIKDYFHTSGRTPSTLTNAFCVKSQVQVSYNPKDLAEHNLWVGIVHLTFKERTTQ